VAIIRARRPTSLREALIIALISLRTPTLILIRSKGYTIKAAILLTKSRAI
jgi:hypothetical protein